MLSGFTLATPPMIFKRSFPAIRRSRRQWINTSVQVFTPQAHMDALGINLSDGGMCFFSVANLPVGSHVDIEFLPPDSKDPVRVCGKVRHRALYLYGIEFQTEANHSSSASGHAALLHNSYHSSDSESVLK